MELRTYEGKNVEVTLKDGQIFTGKVSYHTSAYDNDPDPESITLKNIELFLPEIESIKIL